MIKNLIFDMDGVFLSKSHTLLLKDWTSPERYDFFDNLIFHSNEWRQLNEGLISISDATKVWKENKTLEDKKTIDNIVNTWCSNKIIDKKLVEYVRELKHLGYKLYILSNVPQQMIDYLESTKAYLQYFDGCIYSYKEHLMKPDSKIFETLLKRYDLKPNESLFIDDKQKNLDTANTLGINSFLYVFNHSQDLENFIDSTNEFNSQVVFAN